MRLYRALSRAAIIPFESAISILVIVSGICGLARFGVIDPVFALLPYWEAVAINVMYILAGLGMIVGILSDRGTIESSGLWLLCGSIIARFLLYANYLGVNKNFVITGAFDAVFLLAAFTRMRYIRSRHILVKVQRFNGELDEPA